MSEEFNRRDFLKKSTMAGFTGCALLMAARLNPAFASSPFLNEDDVPDPKLLNYCGYKCPDDCEFLKATVNDDAELKKKVYEQWKIEERHGVEFDPEKIFCWGCKTDKPLGIVVEKCTVRKCCMEKGMDSCIECSELKSCKEDLWERFPEFYKSVIQMQEKYFSAQN